MRTNKLPAESLLTKDALRERGYRYAWIQSISSVQIDEIDNLSLEPGSVIEARFFNETGELHVFSYNDSLTAVETVMEDGDKTTEEVQILRGKYGKSITLRNFIDFDPQDGQAYISRTVLCGYER